MAVLTAETVSQIHEPTCREPDVHIMLPPLLQLKAISEHLTKLALSPTATTISTMRQQNSTQSSSSSRLTLSANMHGSLRISVDTANLKIESKWEGLQNPELDPGVVEGGEEGIRQHASTRMKGVPAGDENAWAKVRVEGRDWGRVLGVGRLGGRVVACNLGQSLRWGCWANSMASTGFCHDHALILYVYLANGDRGVEESVLTVCTSVTESIGL